MARDTFDDSGYESDTGPRDNPRVSNFETNQPVKKGLSGVPHGRGGQTRALNREGRAICRIVHAHGWTSTEIGKIFRVPAKPIRKALQNKYSPPDDASDDYKHVDAEFGVKFPPVEDLSVEDGAASDEELDDECIPSGSVNKRRRANSKPTEVPIGLLWRSSHLYRYSSQVSAPTVKKPRYEYTIPHSRAYSSSPSPAPPVFDSSPLQNTPCTSKSQARSSLLSSVPPHTLPQAPLPLPSRCPPGRSPALLAFLQDVHGLDLSKYHDLFVARGLGDVATLRTMAVWDRAELQETLARLLMGGAAELGGRQGLSALEVISVELAIRALGKTK
ncbi:hypothetical protein DFH09DRAFT_1362331 [Mycena vulgaris]|nr:hypothetical protein DFH09DRAFT_1362331 [Mycena vulgaris]